MFIFLTNLNYQQSHIIRLINTDKLIDKEEISFLNLKITLIYITYLGNLQTVVIDTETTLIVAGEVPRFVLGSAFAGKTVVYLLTRENLGAFCATHANSNVVMHNAPFDIAVINQQVGFDFDIQVRAQRLWDTGLMFQLLELAKQGVGRTALPEGTELDAPAAGHRPGHRQRPDERPGRGTGGAGLPQR